METANEDDDAASTTSSSEEEADDTEDDEEVEEEQEATNKNNTGAAAPARSLAAAAAAADDGNHRKKCGGEDGGGIKIYRDLAKKVTNDDDLAALLKCSVEALAFVTLVEPLTRCRKDACPYPAARCNYSYCVLCAELWYPRIRYNINGMDKKHITKKERGHLLLGSQFSRGAVRQKSYCACGSDLCLGIGYTDSLFSFPNKNLNNDNNKTVLNSWLSCLEQGVGLSPGMKQKILAKPGSYRVAYWHFDPHHLKLAGGSQCSEDGDGDRNDTNQNTKWELLRAGTYTDASGKVWEDCPKHPPPNYDLSKFIASARATRETDLAERRMEGELPPDWVRVMLRAETHPKLLYNTPTSAATAYSMISAATTVTKKSRKPTAKAGAAVSASAAAGLEAISRNMAKKRKALGVDHSMLAAASEKEIKRLKRQLYYVKTEKSKQEAQHAAQVQVLQDKNSALALDNQVLSGRVQEQAAGLEHLNSLIATSPWSGLSPNAASQQRSRNQHHHYRSLR